MLRLTFASLVVVGLISSSTPAQNFKGKDDKQPVAKKKAPPTPTSKPEPTSPPAAPGEVEVVFLNGSKIRMTIQSEKLEIASIYGKLTVPMEDVESIEFGVHFPDGMSARIDAAIRGLNSSDYREREKSAKILLDFGPLAYPAVLKASRAKLPEVSKRARDIVQKLQAKYPKKDLKASTEDRVVTPTQTIVGRILTPTVKTKADYFGAMDHKLANMRTLRAIGAPGQELELSIDAAKFAAGNQWMETSFLLDGKSAIVISAKGMIDQWPQQPGGYMSGPGGSMRGGGVRVIQNGMLVQQAAALPGQKIIGPIAGQIYGGVLLGKIGETGEPFVIAERYEGKPEAEGKLFLMIGPSPWNCPSSGAYDVKISRKGD